MAIDNHLIHQKKLYRYKKQLRTNKINHKNKTKQLIKINKRIMKLLKEILKKLILKIL